jgi:integrase
MPPRYRRPVGPAERARREQATADKLTALHERLAEQVAALRSGEDWRRWLDVARRFHGYSFNNTLLIAAQRPDATAVAGYEAWKALGRQVTKGERGLQILAPVVRRSRAGDDAGAAAAEPGGTDADPAERAGAAPSGAASGTKEKGDRRGGGQVTGWRVAYVWDVSATSGEPLPTPPRPRLLAGQAPPGLWEALTRVVGERGFTVARGDCGAANGWTDYATRTVRVRADVDAAQAVKTLAHDPLTAPSPRVRGVLGERCGYGAPVVGVFVWFWLGVCSGRFDGLQKERRMGEQEQATAREVTRLLIPVVGRVAQVEKSPGTVLLDASGIPVAEVSEFFRTMLASGASTSSLRSYGLALLRWWRFLAAVDVAWERASRVEARDFVLWMRLVGPASRSAGYAPATINHALAVVKMFYADRLAAGGGPLVNPVPNAAHRDGRRVQAHHNPMHPFAPGVRAPLRQKLPERVPRSLPDHLFDALFAVMGSDRDRALLAFYVSTGARASELLGVTLDRVDPGEQRIGVRRKGSGRLQWLPASADAFVWLRLYEQQAQRPEGEPALWLTRRRPVRALTYSATRRMLQRANAAVGTEWTLHDLRRAADDR